jgi:Porin subfamily
MKMVKSLLLGSAAGMVAIAGAQAADLPVKAKPVEYVKICSIYGEGFWYIPGTDTCIKLGGWVRMDYQVGQSSGSFSPDILGGTGRDNAIDQSGSFFQSTFVFSADARSQTEYGTLRAYMRSGFRYATNAYADGTYYVERAFVQLGGWTFGRTASFYDFLNGAFSYNSVFLGGGSVSPFGTLLGAYTWQFGNGLSYTSSIEDNSQRRSYLWDASGFNTLNPERLPAGAFLLGPSTTSNLGYTTCGTTQALFTNDGGGTFPGACGLGDYANVSLPDFVSTLRVDQAWGSAQVAVGIHQITAGYYGNNIRTTDPSFTGVAPSDKYGFAVMGGVSWNLPFIAKGDKFWVEAHYTEGAPAYTGLTEMQLANTQFLVVRGNRATAQWVPDAIFFNACPGFDLSFNHCASGIQLTTAWTIGAAYEHYWSPAVRSALWGTFTSVSFDETAKIPFCDFVGADLIHGDLNPLYQHIGGKLVATSANAPLTQGCNPDFNVWGVGVRTIWNPVPNLDVGLEVMYAEVDQKYDPRTWFGSASPFGGGFTGSGGTPTGQFQPANLGIWSAMLRIQRNFYP